MLLRVACSTPAYLRSMSFSAEAAGTMLSELGRRFPIFVAWFFLLSTWLMFLIFVSVERVLKERGDWKHFIIQVVVFHSLLGLSGVSLIAACSHRPIRPNQDLAPPDARPLLPDEVRTPERREAPGDDDDIPLRLLRDARMQPPRDEARGGAEEAGEEAEMGVEEDRALLAKPEEEVDTTLMAKNGNGLPRWCRKCDGWKPDRCHHCRSCRQCVLKMDHHCPWINNCVGYHNYKYFMLFISYTAVLSGYGGYQAGYETYRMFAEPPEFDSGRHAATKMDQSEAEELFSAFKPVIVMLVAILGLCFALAVGGMAGYHWYLLLNNRSTLEDLNRGVPAVLLDQETRATLEALGDRGSRQQVPGAWRPDHLLTRPERTRLRREAREINVYDMGWKANARQVMLGDGHPPPTTWRGLLVDVARAAWPLAQVKPKRYGAGHFFSHDPDAVQRLKDLTTELRLVAAAGRDRPRAELYTGGQWSAGDESEESDGSDTTYVDHGRAPRYSA